MSDTRVPLSVLDLVPVSSGSDSREALRNSIDLAQRAEALGYSRYWLAEHHLNPGNAGSASLAFCAVLAGATRTIRLGTAATLLGQWAPLQIAEAAGLVATLYDGRMDLGLGRTLTPPPPPAPGSPAVERPTPPPASTVDGLLLPSPVAGDPRRGRFGLLAELVLRRPETAFEDGVTTILRQLDGTFTDAEGDPVPVLPAVGSGAAVWVHGSSGGESARVAGRLGLPFGANYHTTPWSVLDAVAAYRAAFRPGRIAEPRVIVSADVLVADTEAEAERIGRGFDRWVLSVRAGNGTIEYPAPDDAVPLTPAEQAQVQDRVATRFVGDPARVVERLETLQRVTGADEILLTTSTHAHADRVRSYELLAEAWGVTA
ncbi:LLM class flavin-dependent oxidoreductase [Frondihabitans peucedani]|uniref:LLM class flavin-dependent oxidoreductase n=1 Tax=Frondihabitans peucedani TaxID=598626 RepID=A0ABP8E1K3_9MICO